MGYGERESGEQEQAGHLSLMTAPERNDNFSRRYRQVHGKRRDGEERPSV